MGSPLSADLTCYQVCVPCVFPFHEAAQVLDLFRDQFIKEMDANAVVLELLHSNIIDRGDERRIAMTLDPTQQNQFLHLILKETCTEEAFETVCDIITAVKGNPKMKSLGESMKRRLETGGYTCVGQGDCMRGCMCLCLCMGVLCGVCMDVCVAEYFNQSRCILLFCFAGPLSSDLLSVPTSSSSQSGATTADKGPSPEMEALPTAQQGMLHAVSLHMSAPHSVPCSVGGVSVHVCADMSSSCCSGTWLFWLPLGQGYVS